MDKSIKGKIVKPLKYDFIEMSVGHVKNFYDTYASAMISATIRFNDRYNLNWKFKCVTNGDKIEVTRIA